MINHVVCFKLSDRADAESTKRLLLSMRGKVPSAREIEVGVDFLGSPRSYDIILQVRLDSREALELYQNDPYHAGVVKQHMHKVACASVAVDYEL